MKRALLVCTDSYPDGDAGAVRTHVFAKMLESMGYEPTVVGLGKTTNFQFKTHENVLYISLRSESESFFAKSLNRVLFHKRLEKYIFKNNHIWDLIVFSPVSEKTISFLKKYSSQKNVPLVHDSIEWYSHEQFFLGKLHPTYIAKNRLNKKLIDKRVKVIAISSYLERYFSGKGIKTIRIPVIMDTKLMGCEKNIEQKKHVFVYAGSPGKKDYLNVVVSGFAKIKKDFPYELRLIGITKEQLISLCGVDPSDVEKLGDHLCCIGRVPRKQVLEHLSHADFTILMRSEEQRYAKAGFPTKFVESLATATPVISNATSDIANYLKDGENGFLVSECSAEALSRSLEKALELSFDERLNMQKNARLTAEECFDYQKYSEKLMELIK